MLLFTILVLCLNTFIFMIASIKATVEDTKHNPIVVGSIIILANIAAILHLTGVV